jgi:hypothetical protein
MSHTATPPATGAIFVVEEASKFNAERTRGTIVLESTAEKFATAIDELKSAAARNKAIEYASTQGMGNAMINGNLIGPYAINNKGVPLDKMMEDHAENPLPPGDPLMKIFGYRVEVPVARSMR